MYLYILELENGRYFLHQSSEDDLDLFYFKRKKNIEFLQYFKPIAIVAKYNDPSEYEIEEALIGYMKEHSIDYVRSTRYPDLKLTSSDRKFFEKQIKQGGTHPGYGIEDTYPRILPYYEKTHPGYGNGGKQYD